jgi:hypothetical protein
VRLLFATLLVLISCAKAPQTKEAVKQAIVDYLAKRDDMMASSMEVEVVSVDFKQKEAEAVASIGPKGSHGSGIRISYTLEAEGAKWVVKRKPGSAPAASSNPHTPSTPVHEGIDGSAPGGKELPAGHPPIPATPGKP